MAPKIKIRKEEITQKAFEIVASEGINALTAKSLAKKLNCSTQPIFWWYSNMEEVISIVIEMAQTLFSEYLHREIEGVNTFKAIGINYITFAMEQKNLFKLLYMSEKVLSEDIMSDDKNMPFVLEAIRQDSSISQEQAQKLFREMWLFSHGIATMIATDTARFSKQEIYDMLSDVCKGLMMNLKDNNNN